MTTTPTDTDRLVAFLHELAVAYEQALDAEVPGSSPAIGLTGALNAIEAVRYELPALAAQGTAPKPARTPVERISKPAHTLARRGDPGTSLEAAVAASTGKRQELYSAIIGALRDKPLTDDELTQTLDRLPTKFSDSGIRSRRAELVEAGWVEDSGQRRLSRYGHPSTVWTLAD